MEAAKWMPHSHCVAFDEMIIWSHAICDTLIAVAYLSIPSILVLVYGMTRNRAARRILLQFSAFITLCAGTHICDALEWWIPEYWIFLVVKAACAAVSISVAVTLLLVVPRFLSSNALRLLREEQFNE